MNRKLMLATALAGVALAGCGSSELICNQPNHYADGMHAQLLVT
jgi:uncharacterized cupredoxin-like copper-binding protein